jgi:O-antigen ligase
VAFPQDGWRSARSRRHYPGGDATPAPGQQRPPGRPAAGPLPGRPPAVPAIPTVPAVPARGRRVPAPAATGSMPAHAEAAPQSLWKLIVSGVEWTPLFVGLLVYVFTVTTYAVAAGDVAMAFCLVVLGLQKDPLRLPPFLIWFGVLVAWCWLGYASTDYPDAVWDTAYDLIKLWAIVLVAVNALRTRAQLRFFMIFFLACFAFYPTRGAYFNYYIYNQRPFGRAVWQFIYANPNDLAMLTVLQLSMAAGLLASEGKNIVRTAALAGTGVLTLLVFMTQSRGAIIALGLFGIATLANSKRQRFRTAALFVAVAGVLVVFAPSSVWERLRGLKNVTSNVDLRSVDKSDMGSAAQRFEIWRVARKIIGDHPLSGVGVGAYALAHFKYSQHPEFKSTAHGYRDTHSTYLNVTAETGFPGLLLFLGVFGTVALHAERVRRRARDSVPRTARQLLFLEMGLLAFFTAGIFGSYTHLSFAYLHAVLVWAFAEMVDGELAARAPRRGWTPPGPRGARGGALPGGAPRRAPA